MRELTFGPGDIRAWAHFSGDQNPIHFDPVRAGRAGAHGVVVHGMLVLLTVKNHASAVASASEGTGGPWWRFRSRLRQPVVAGDTVQLATRPQGEGIAFSVSSATRDRKLMTGSLLRQEVPSEDGTPWLRLDLPADLVAARAAELLAAFPWIGEPWVIADALIFSEFLRTGMRDLLTAHGIDLVTGTAAGGDFVVQTSHEVGFDRDFFARSRPLDAALEVEASPPAVEGVEAGVYATCTLVARCRGRAVMRLSLGIAIIPEKPAYAAV
jgi:hypothetical protein